jgi:hypothetical protein
MLTRSRVLAIDDYLPTASPTSWLPDWLADKTAALCGPTPAKRGPWPLRRILLALPLATDTRDPDPKANLVPKAELTALVHLGPIDRRIDDAHASAALEVLVLGGAVLDIAFARGLFARPWRRTAVFDATALRLEAWGRLGVAQLEQWVCGDGRGLVITLGTKLASRRE